MFPIWVQIFVVFFLFASFFAPFFLFSSFLSPFGFLSLSRPAGVCRTLFLFDSFLPPFRLLLGIPFGDHFGPHLEVISELILDRELSCGVTVKSCKRGNPNLEVLEELRRKKGEKGLREREKMRKKSALRNRWRERE